MNYYAFIIAALSIKIKNENFSPFFLNFYSNQKKNKQKQLKRNTKQDLMVLFILHCLYIKIKIKD